MTDPEPAKAEHQLAENWEFTRDVADRVTALETWRAATEAASALRWRVIPIALSTIAVTVTVLNVLFLSRHR